MSKSFKVTLILLLMVAASGECILTSGNNSGSFTAEEERIIAEKSKSQFDIIRKLTKKKTETTSAR